MTWCYHTSLKDTLLFTFMTTGDSEKLPILRYTDSKNSIEFAICVARDSNLSGKSKQRTQILIKPKDWVPNWFKFQSFIEPDEQEKPNLSFKLIYFQYTIWQRFSYKNTVQKTHSCTNCHKSSSWSRRIEYIFALLKLHGFLLRIEIFNLLRDRHFKQAYIWNMK